MSQTRYTPDRPFRTLTDNLVRHGNETSTLVANVPNFLSREECERVVAAAQRAGGHQGVVGVADPKVEPIRKSDVRFFYPDASTTWLFDKLDQAVSALNRNYRFELQGFFEGVQVASYSGGGHYGWHMDVGQGAVSTRKLSLSVQLSDERDYEGGELEFLVSGDCGPRRQGTLIAFPSFLVHRVRPVTRGTRWSLVSWVAGPSFR